LILEQKFLEGRTVMIDALKKLGDKFVEMIHEGDQELLGKIMKLKERVDALEKEINSKREGGKAV